MNLDYTNIDDITIGIYRDGPVGIGISGGADSAVLLYILMSNVKHTVHIYNMSSVARVPVFGKNVDAVVKCCSELTGNTNYVVHKTILEHDESMEYYFNMLTEALDKQEVDVMYMGVTSFPPREVYLPFNGQQPEWHNDFRNGDVIKPLFGLTVPVHKADDFGESCPLSIDGNPIDSLSLDTRVYVPLFNHNKKDIAKLYRHFNLEKTLLPVTRSCENDQHLESHCGNCWWCHERIWAFGNLGELQ
jgi:hypothetical protein